MGASADIMLPYNLTLRPEVRYVSDCYLSGDYNIEIKALSYMLHAHLVGGKAKVADRGNTLLKAFAENLHGHGHVFFEAQH
ncbi:MAG: Plug protein [Thermodesulfobacteriota bacterium]|nr:Plug protein [Thermodesulfobacteriota bacterium]